MDVFIDVVVTIVGLALLAVTLYDLFQSVVLPRPAVNKVQLARIVIRPLWIAWRWIGLRSSRLDRNEARLAAFGPVSLLVLFGIWAFALILAYGLIIYGVRDEFHPVLQDFPESFYVSASTLVPLAYGDFIPEQGFARTVIFFESLTGVALAAPKRTLVQQLHSVFGHYPANLNAGDTPTQTVRLSQLFTVADSRMPITNRKVTMAMIMTAGRLKMAATCVPRADFEPKWFRRPITGPLIPRSVGLLSSQTTGSSRNGVSRSQMPSVYRIAPPRLVVLSAGVSLSHTFIFWVTARDCVARSRPRSTMSLALASIR